MSENYSRRPVEHTSFDDEREAIVEQIEAFAEQVDERVTELTQCWPDATDPEANMRAVTLQARIMQLQGLSGFTLNLSADGEDNRLLDLDSTLVVTKKSFEAAYSHLPKDDVDAALDDGRHQGTDDFLRLLAPDGLDKLECPEMCFYPYKKSALQGYFPIAQFEGGAAAVSLSTVFPNISVYLLYSPNNDYPQYRLIGLAGKEQ